jgi:hypothetical protein
VLEAEVTAAVTVVALVTTSHEGEAGSVAEKFSVQLVTVPLPVEMTPTLSVPATDGAIPQEEIVGAPSEHTTW